MPFERQELFLTEEDKRQGFWVQDDVHLPYPFTPLYACFQTIAMKEGTLRAFETIRAPMKQFYTKIENGYLYQWTKPYEGDLQQRLEEHKRFSGERFSRLKVILDDYVQTEFLPFYKKLDTFRRTSFTREQAKEQLLQLHQFYIRAWELHFEIVMPRSPLLFALEDLYGQLTKAKDPTVIYEWYVGVMNKTLETDREIGRLAKRVKESEELTDLFKETAVENLLEQLQTIETGQSFLTELDSFLEVYGYRATHSHEFVAETWIEDPTPVLGVIAQYVEKDVDFDTEFAKLVEKRRAKFEAAVKTFPEGELKETFLQLYQWALDSWGLDEDHHFYIDAMLPAKSRLFLMAVGELLVREGAFEQANDICFLYLDEVLGLLDQPVPSKELITERKREWEENKKKKPIPFYGEPPQGHDPVLERIFGTRAPEVEKTSIKGYAASQGVYTGKVRMIRSPADFSSVQQGEVLVCRTTTPTWTTLFSVVGAVVTDAGGILSHAATVAREYELPAVVGTKVATTMLQDGQTVTVDGTQGLVLIHE